MGVAEYPTEDGPATQVVVNYYDVENRWIGQTIDRDGDGNVDHTRWFGYDGSQIVVQFDQERAGRVTGQDQSHRYLWGPAVDQILADERLSLLPPEEGAGYDVGSPGSVLWPLADHLGTVRDLAEYDPRGEPSGVRCLWRPAV